MKITKTSSAALDIKLKRLNANKGCNVCPCCGESKDMLDYLKEGITNKGISGGIIKTTEGGFWNYKITRTDYYNCLTCGAEWESESY